MSIYLYDHADDITKSEQRRRELSQLKHPFRGNSMPRGVRNDQQVAHSLEIFGQIWMTSAALVMVGCENRKPRDDEPSDVIRGAY